MGKMKIHLAPSGSNTLLVKLISVSHRSEIEVDFACDPFGLVARPSHR